MVDASDEEAGLGPTSTRRAAGRSAPERRRMRGAAPEVGAEYAGRTVSAAAAFRQDEDEEGGARVDGFAGWSEEEDGADGGGSSGSDGDDPPPPSRPAPRQDATHAAADRAEDEEIAALEAEYAAAEAADASMAAALAARAAAEAAKGEAVRAQQGVWGRALEARICLQRAVGASNRLPRPPPLGSFHDRPELRAEVAAVADAAAALAAELWGSAEALLGAAVAARGGGGEASAAAPPPPAPWLPAGKDKKRSRTDWLWARGEAAMAAAAPFRDASFDRWHRKAALLSGGGGGKAGAGAAAGLRALGQPPSAQVAAAMADVARLVERARLPVEAAPARVGGDVTPTRVVCGDSPPSSDDDGDGVPGASAALRRDPDTYDDGEFYAQLLKEFVEAAGVGPGSALGGAGSAAAAARHRRRKAVDRRASKGRKLRFDVHDKLVGFMAADDRAGTPPLARQLVGALFGGGRAG